MYSKGSTGVGMVENVSKCFEYTIMPSLHKINTIKRKCENRTCLNNKLCRLRNILKFLKKTRLHHNSTLLRFSTFLKIRSQSIATMLPCCHTLESLLTSSEQASISSPLLAFPEVLIDSVLCTNLSRSSG